MTRIESRQLTILIYQNNQAIENQIIPSNLRKLDKYCTIATYDKRARGKNK